MTLLVDNCDSFTYNLYQMIGEIDEAIKVIKNDDLMLEEIKLINPEKIVISSGAGRPNGAGICKAVIDHFAGKIPILGVSLGHLCICEAFGAQTEHAKIIPLGVKKNVQIANGSPLFRGLSPVIKATHFNALTVSRETIPDSILIIAECDNGEVMGIKHRDHDTYGIQFQPESFTTQGGNTIIANFLKMGGSLI